MREAILLYTTVAMGPMPPEVEKTRGENVPCSTSLTRSSNALFSITGASNKIADVGGVSKCQAVDGHSTSASGDIQNPFSLIFTLKFI